MNPAYRAGILLPGLLAALLLGPSPAPAACDPGPDLDWWLDNASLIAIGTVLETRVTTARNGESLRETRFQISNRYRMTTHCVCMGIDGSAVTVTSRGGECGFPVSLGERYLLFLRPDAETDSPLYLAGDSPSLRHVEVPDDLWDRVLDLSVGPGFYGDVTAAVEQSDEVFRGRLLSRSTAGRDWERLSFQVERAWKGEPEPTRAVYDLRTGDAAPLQVYLDYYVFVRNWGGDPSLSCGSILPGRGQFLDGLLDPVTPVEPTTWGRIKATFGEAP